MNLGKRFASPVKKGAPRTKRAKQRQHNKDIEETLSACSSQSVTPSIPDSESSSVSAPLQQPPLIVVAGEQLEVDYQLYELPDVDSIVAKTPETPAHGS